jgi:hypothetical protein
MFVFSLKLSDGWLLMVPNGTISLGKGLLSLGGPFFNWAAGAPFLWYCRWLLLRRQGMGRKPFYLAISSDEALRDNWAAIWCSWRRCETTTFRKPLAKGEVRVRALTSEQAADGKRHAGRFEKFKRLIRLNENIGKADQEIWERDLGDGDMKRFLIFLLLFPALATASFYAVLYILTGAVVDSLSGPALCYLVFIVPALVVALVDRSASRLGVIHCVIATALFAYGVSFLTVACALGLHNVILAFGLVGGIPAAVCSWLSNEKQNGSVAAHPGQVFPHPQRPE